MWARINSLADWPQCFQPLSEVKASATRVCCLIKHRNLWNSETCVLNKYLTPTTTAAATHTNTHTLSHSLCVCVCLWTESKAYQLLKQSAMQTRPQICEELDDDSDSLSGKRCALSHLGLAQGSVFTHAAVSPVCVCVCDITIENKSGYKC